MIKILFIILGTIFLIIGIIGIFVPGLPTTPFLLLTAGLYIRSSNYLYKSLISNRYIGSIIIEFQKKKGMSIKLKIYSIIIMWIMISISEFMLTIPYNIIVFFVGIIGTIVMGFIIPTVKKPNKH